MESEFNLVKTHILGKQKQCVDVLVQTLLRQDKRRLAIVNANPIITKMSSDALESIVCGSNVHAMKEYVGVRDEKEHRENRMCTKCHKDRCPSHPTISNLCELA